MEKPEWPPESDEELHGTDLLMLWQDAAKDWHEYAELLEGRAPPTGPPDVTDFPDGSFGPGPPIAPDIERLAEVAHHANMGEGGGRPHPWEDQPGIYKELMRRIARAVLEAMGEGPPAEEPDGSQCDTCDEYSDACDCVCAVEEREGALAEEPEKEVE